MFSQLYSIRLQITESLFFIMFFLTLIIFKCKSDIVNLDQGGYMGDSNTRHPNSIPETSYDVSDRWLSPEQDSNLGPKPPLPLAT